MLWIRFSGSFQYSEGVYIYVPISCYSRVYRGCNLKKILFRTLPKHESKKIIWGEVIQNKLEESFHVGRPFTENDDVGL